MEFRTHYLTVSTETVRLPHHSLEYSWQGDVTDIKYRIAVYTARRRRSCAVQPQSTLAATLVKQRHILLL